MKHKIAIKIMLGLLFIVVVFHFCIMAKLIPYNIAWGGQITNDTEMYVFETISIVINLFLSLILLMKGNYITVQFREKTVNIVLWIFLAIFILNTVGNIFAKTNFEKFFAVLTLLFALLIGKILRKKNTKPTTSVSV
jgi:hypothetical protein